MTSFACVSSGVWDDNFHLKGKIGCYMAEPRSAAASDHFFIHMQSSPPTFLMSGKLTLINHIAEAPLTGFW